MLSCAKPRRFFFFFNDTATTEIYTLSLHDALPIFAAVDRHPREVLMGPREELRVVPGLGQYPLDRKSTRLNSSHSQISYAVFCLKKKKTSRSTNTKPHASRIATHTSSPLKPCAR